MGNHVPHFLPISRSFWFPSRLRLPKTPHLGVQNWGGNEEDGLSALLTGHYEDGKMVWGHATWHGGTRLPAVGSAHRSLGADRVSIRQCLWHQEQRICVLMKDRRDNLKKKSPEFQDSQLQQHSGTNLIRQISVRQQHGLAQICEAINKKNNINIINGFFERQSLIAKAI